VKVCLASGPPTASIGTPLRGLLNDGRSPHADAWPLFLRGLAIVYLIAFASLPPQILGLIGSNGITPASQYLDAVHQQLGPAPFWTLPTLAWMSSSDTFLQVICWSGVVLSVLLLAGFAPFAMLFALWMLYLSIVNIGQEFLLFQWDALLLEAGFAALLIAPAKLWMRTITPPATAIWVFRLLIFRLMFESGLVKLLSGDQAWRHLTALTYHYHTQPLPTPLAWYADHLPLWFQRISVAGLFAVELAVPILFLLPNRKLRAIGAGLTITLQLVIASTGNYTFFNLLTIVLCIPLFISDTNPAPRRVGISVVAAFLIAIGALQLLTMLAGNALPTPVAIVDEEAQLWHVVNTYGLFAVMTTTRPEIIVEGSDDGETWKPYEFKFKPQDPMLPPRWVAPYQPRLDWQMWFAALSNYQSTPWFAQFMRRLLEGAPEVLALLKTNPFASHPPRYVRALLYDYSFSDPQTRRSTGEWWVRTQTGIYFPAVSLHEASLIR